MKRSPIDHVEKARLAWGDTPPDWVIALAEQCNATSQAAAGRRIAYAGSTISQVISNAYLGDLPRVEDMVRGAFMASTIECPVLGEMARNVCLDWQRRPYSDASALHIKMWRACRSCPLAQRKGEAS